ncbi:MAG TPA: hypothetical protein VGC67_13680, partial [Cellulomonas sp.]
GGVLVVVGVAEDGDRVRDALSLVLNPVVGLIRHPRPARSVPTGMTAPVAAPRETFAQIHAVLTTALPGVRVRRRLFWRYTAVWAAPAGLARRPTAPSARTSSLCGRYGRRLPRTRPGGP